MRPRVGRVNLVLRVERELDLCLGFVISRNVLPLADGRAGRFHQHWIPAYGRHRIHVAFGRNYDFQPHDSADVRFPERQRIARILFVDELSGALGLGRSGRGTDLEWQAGRTSPKPATPGPCRPVAMNSKHPANKHPTHHRFPLGSAFVDVMEPAAMAARLPTYLRLRRFGAGEKCDNRAHEVHRGIPGSSVVLRSSS